MFELFKKNLIFIVWDLCRIVLFSLDILVSIYEEIVLIFEVVVWGIIVDCEICLVKFMLLLYVSCFNLKLLDWMINYYR